MSASHWPDWLRVDPQNKFPTAFRLIISAITGAGLALSFTWVYFPVYAWVSIGLLLMMVLGAKPRVAYFCGFYHAMAFVFASLSWIAEVLAVHGGTSRLAGWGILLLIAMAWGVLTGFHLDREPHRASKCGASVHSSTICVGHIGIRTRTSAGNRFSVESAGIFRCRQSGVAANNCGHGNLRLVVRNGRV